MQLTAQDKRAAREGFKYVVVRAGERVCYTTTLGEAKRECGKSGKVVSISGMRYTAQNPSSGAKQRARGTRSYGKGLFVEADLSGRHARMLDKAAGVRRKSAKLGPTYTKLMHREALAEAARVRNPSRGGTKYYLYTGVGPIYYQPLQGRFNSKKQAVAYAKMAHGVDMALPMFHKAKILSSRELAAKQTRVPNPSLNVRNPSLNVRNPAKQPVVVYEYEGGEIVNAQLIDYASDLASAKHAAERMGYAVSSVKHGDFGWGSSWVTGYEVKVKQSNPSLNVRNPASKVDTVALALAKVDKRAGQVAGGDNSIEARAKRLRKSGYVVAGDRYGWSSGPKNVNAATILTEFKGGEVSPPSSSYSWSFDLNRELGNKAWEVSPVNSAVTLIYKW